MTKKNVLFISLIGTLLFFSQFLFDSGSCGNAKLCNKIGDVLNQDNLTLIFIIPFVFLLSLITYKMREEVFQAWWNFARWFVPIIIIVTYLINSAHQQGGFAGVAQGAFEFLILFVFYALFIIITLVRIILAYRRLK
jgi:hypothetical protein